MLALTILPLAVFASTPLSFRISGGLFQDFAPCAYHMQQVLLPTLARMGVRSTLTMLRPGYVPRGGGMIEMETHPTERKLAPISLTEPGAVRSVHGVSLASHLKSQKVAERMARQCRKGLSAKGLHGKIEIVDDATASQRGAALFVCAETATGCLIGADRAGRVGRRAEDIGTFVAQSLVEDLDSGATVDRHLADQLILFAGLAEGTSRYMIPHMTEHVDTNLWLIDKILGAETRVAGHQVIIRGVGFQKKGVSKRNHLDV
jgi:RNA 3'-terminal phosphate cyclase (ATP)